mmetsp:Transcript_15609/g.31664  ORF Transcript_15609/g.31664 Transcript_15609/m.31664 type:complete len:98 (-) Transcript_15609:2195-2488(-)
MGEMFGETALHFSSSFTLKTDRQTSRGKREKAGTHKDRQTSKKQQCMQRNENAIQRQIEQNTHIYNGQTSEAFEIELREAFSSSSSSEASLEEDVNG